MININVIQILNMTQVTNRSSIGSRALFEFWQNSEPLSSGRMLIAPRWFWLTSQPIEHWQPASFFVVTFAQEWQLAICTLLLKNEKVFTVFVIKFIITITRINLKSLLWSIICYFSLGKKYITRDRFRYNRYWKWLYCVILIPRTLKVCRILII